MEPECPLPQSQASATGPYPEPDQSSLSLPSHFLKIHFNIILPCAPKSSKWSISIGIPHQNSACTSPVSLRATCSAHHIFLDFIARIIFGEHRRYFFSLYTLLHFPVIWALLGPNNFLYTLFSDTLRLCSSLNVRNQVSHRQTDTHQAESQFCVSWSYYFWIANCKITNSTPNVNKHFMTSICF